jgi:hypothetical protein
MIERANSLMRYEEPKINFRVLSKIKEKTRHRRMATAPHEVAHKTVSIKQLTSHF